VTQPRQPQARQAPPLSSITCLRPGATIQATEIAVYLALGADWAAVGRGGWRPLATLFAAMLVPVAWSRRIVDFC
jgi:hypothetical protein